MPVPADTAEGLLTQLNEIIAFPDTGLTRQRLAVWLEGVRPELWEPLIKLADGRFTKSELRRWLPELARQWAKADPASAIPSLAGRTGYVPMDGKGLAALGFEIWHHAAPEKALAWLMEHQDDQGISWALPDFVSVIGRNPAAIPGDASLRRASQLQGRDLEEAALNPLWEKLGKDQQAWASLSEFR